MHSSMTVKSRTTKPKLEPREAILPCDKGGCAGPKELFPGVRLWGQTCQMEAPLPVVGELGCLVSRNESIEEKSPFAALNRCALSRLSKLPRQNVRQIAGKS
jgi:hypothetical protein